MRYNPHPQSETVIMYIRFIPAILALFFITSACTRFEGDYKLPWVYRIDIQQGNVIDQDMLDQLKPGMNKNQVRFIMGTPAIEDPFHATRWDYIYTQSWGGARRQQIHLALYFEEEKLAYLDGDVVTALRKPPEEFKKQSRIVDVPIEYQRQRGLIEKMVDAIPFVGDDPPPTPPEEEEILESDNPENVP